MKHLDRDPPDVTNLDLSKHRYLQFDGKYILGRKYSVCILFDAITKNPIDGMVFKSESYKNIYPWLLKLKCAGLEPTAITTDGLYTVIRAFREVFPGIITQRCLFHIEMQIGMWLRFRPKSRLAQDLKALLPILRNAYVEPEALRFKQKYLKLRNSHRAEIEALDNSHPVEDDLAKCFTLLDKALDCMFNFINDPRISRTTSALEGYNKKIQDIRGFRHCGLTEDHLIKFIKHKIHSDSIAGISPNTDTFLLNDRHK